MKNVLITSDYFTKSPYTILENLDDLTEYAVFLSDITSESVAKFIRSDIKTHKYFDHAIDTTNHGENILKTSYNKCKISGGNPIFDTSNMVDERLQSYLKYILNGDTVCINKKGGHCPLDNDWIVEEDNTAPESNYFISKTPSLLNLENDAELEQHTIEFFDNNALGLSFVKRLRKFDKAQLIEIFSEFKKKGGYGLYVYTTGMDVPQMHDYCKAAIESELTEIVFEFSAGKTAEHIEFIEIYKDLINII